MLTEPDRGFRWRLVGERPVLLCDALAGVADHFFTARAWPLGSDGVWRQEDSWAEVAHAAGVPPARLFRLRQVHGATVVVHRRGELLPAQRPEADAIVSDDPHVALAVQAADCVPLLIADARTGAVAAAHAGWRGLAAGTVAAAVRELTRSFGSRPEDLVAVAGPSIGVCCYEVGADVRAALEQAGGPQASRWFHDAPVVSARNRSMDGVVAGRPGRSFFDGWQATRDALAGAGVAVFHQPALCTASHGEWPSYRRDGSRAGRIAAVIRTRRTT